MTADAALIDKLGGPTKVAEMLGYDKGGVQRVFNWRARGIPPKVKLERPDLFLPDMQNGMVAVGKAEPITEDAKAA